MKIPYNNLYTHFVFTTFKREPLIPEVNRIRIEKYITGIVNRNLSRLYAIYANPEHMHFLVSRSPALSEEELATVVADGSEQFIHKYQLAPPCFCWQQSASAFSVSKSHVERVCKYILDQPHHHQKMSYNDEHEWLLKYYQGTIKRGRKGESGGAKLW
jgi:REP element-mobilizing transposase RayT